MAGYAGKLYDPEGNPMYPHGLAKTTFLLDGKNVEDALKEKADKGDVPTDLSWESITGKPTTFTPATHSHAWDSVTGKPSSFTPATHSHPWDSVTGKPTTFPPATHSHAWDNVTGKPSTFSPASHAASGTTYGAANQANYGHVRLLSATNNTAGVDGGYAATPSAVKAAYDLANGKASAPVRASLIFSGNCSAHGTGQNEVVRIGKMVIANVGIYSTTKMASDKNLSVTIPEGYRPVGSVTTAGVFGNMSSPAVLGTVVFMNTGGIYINYNENSYSARYVWATLCYWIP